MIKDEKDIEFELQHFNGNAVIESNKELERFKNKYNFRVRHAFQSLTTIRKELRLLTRMTQCHRTRSEMFRLSEDIKDVYERLGNKL